MEAFQEFVTISPKHDFHSTPSLWGHAPLDGHSALEAPKQMGAGQVEGTQNDSIQIQQKEIAT